MRTVVTSTAAMSGVHKASLAFKHSAMLSAKGGLPLLKSAAFGCNNLQNSYKLQKNNHKLQNNSTNRWK